MKMPPRSVPEPTLRIGQGGYLGDLRGMYFDPIRGKYFPNIPSGSGSVSTTPRLPFAAEAPVAQRGRGSNGLKAPNPATDPSSASGLEVRLDPSASSAGRGILRMNGRDRGERRPAPLVRSRIGPGGRHDNFQRSHFSNLGLTGVGPIIEEGDTFTSIQNFDNGTIFTTTNSGCVWLHAKDRQISKQTSFGGKIIGMHFDVPRMRHLVVSVSSVYASRLRHSFGDEHNCFHKVSEKEQFSMSGFDGQCALGRSNSLVTFRYESLAAMKSTDRRLLPSDPLTIHQTCRDIRYVGLRNSQIIRSDLRTPSRGVDVISKMQRGKAVVKVQRLDDSAVPFGLLASGMCSELLLFDVRFASKPLRSLHGHINNFHLDLGLATTANDKFLFAAGSDHRIRAWSLLDGERLQPDIEPNIVTPFSQNPLTRYFPDRPTAISITENGTMDVGVENKVYRFQAQNGRRAGTAAETELRIWPDLD